MRIRLSVAQLSALECAGIDEEFPALLKAWQGCYLVFEPAEADAISSELTDRSNGEDAAAEQASDPAMRRQARGASIALGNLSSRILREVSMLRGWELFKPSAV